MPNCVLYIVCIILRPIKRHPGFSCMYKMVQASCISRISGNTLCMPSPQREGCIASTSQPHGTYGGVRSIAHMSLTQHLACTWKTMRVVVWSKGCIIPEATVEIHHFSGNKFKKGLCCQMNMYTKCTPWTHTWCLSFYRHVSSCVLQ